MIHPVFSPALGTLIELKIVEWTKSAGDKVSRGDTLFVMQSDKADMDVESFNSGYLAAILVQAGEMTPVGREVALIAETKAEIPLAQQQARKLIGEKLIADQQEGLGRNNLNKFEQEKLKDSRFLSLAIPSIRLASEIKTKTFEDFYIKHKRDGLTMTGLLVKIVAKALTKHPSLNACFTETGIKYNSSININIPVFKADGQTVFPTVFNVAKKDLRSLSIDCLNLTDRAIKNRLKPEQYNRSNITIINLGMLGVDRFDTALFEEQSCTITFGSPSNQVISVDGESVTFGIVKQMSVSSICDRRIVRPDIAAAFLQDLALLMENIAALSQI